ncbi:MAG: phosphotransferase [Candidatus Omnitrophica bacterium]|nr:phosphotransferase [Candidatus Omnitrophota bacterium]
MLLCKESELDECILHSDVARRTIFVFTDGAKLPSYKIKVYEKSGRERAERMCRLMERIYDHDAGVLRGSVQKALSSGEESGYFVIREAYEDGTPMEAHAQRRGVFWRKRFLKDLELASAWIGGFHKAFSVGRVAVSADMVRFFRDKVAASIAPDFLKVPFEGIDLPTVVAHRDFRPSNILIAQDGIRVIDWDRYQPEWFPLFDLIEFVLRYIHARYGLQKTKMHLEKETVLRYFDLFYLKEGVVSKAVRDSMRAYSATVGLTEGQKDLLILLWLYSMLSIGEKDSYLPLKLA